MTKKHLFLIDAYGFLFRAYHSMPPLTRSDGTPIGAVLGFTNMLLKLHKNMHELHSDNNGTEYYAAVILDAGQKTFRNEIYPAYKANRPPAPEDLIPQFPLVREASKAMNLPTLELIGYEADDLIATYAKQAKEEGMKVTIVSSDKDLMQLVDDDVAMYDAAKDRRIEAKQVEEKFGVTPDKVLDALSLIGDSSDNVPGIPGIGPKTAAELINQYGDLDTLLARAEEIKQNKRRESLIEFADQARLSRELIKLCETVPVKETLADLKMREPDHKTLLDFLREQDFKSLIARYEKELSRDGVSIPEEKKPSAPKHAAAHSKKVAQNYKLIKETKDLSQWLENIVGQLAIWIEIEKNRPIGIAFCHAPGQACYIPVGQNNSSKQGTLDLLDTANDNEQKGIPLDVIADNLKSYFYSPSILKIAHDIKLDAQFMPLPSPVSDIQIMSYILDGSQNKHDLQSISEHALGACMEAPGELNDKKVILGEIDPQKIYQYICSKADAVLQIYEKLQQRLFSEKTLTVYETIERPLIPVLTKMEKTGVKVDATVLKKMSDDFAIQIEKTEKEIYELAGEEFNIGSPKQLGEVLFEHMGIQGGKKSKKSGGYGTGADILEELSVQGHTIADRILHWRQLSKLKSTYTDALPKEINKETGRIHTTFAMTVASTGRLSSVNPNLQNIPIRTEEGKKIRTAFVAEKGHKLISADYSQIELRLLACIADIKELKQAFANGEDIHAHTASQVFGMPIEKVTANDRRNAKTINFGILYGLSAFGLAARLGIPRGAAKELIDAYFRRFPGIVEYMKKTKEFAREHGYTQTIYGRKCFVPGINTKGPQRAFAERAAINAPLQGTAADIIKKAMIRLDKALPKEARMTLQIHDELLVEAPEKDAEKIAQLMKKVMEDVNHFDVPFTVEANIGNNWGEIH